jgi:hypothetical protein
MGTRGLTMVIRKGKPVIAQYGQWDHYPSGQGISALKFLQNLVSIPNQTDAFINKLETKVRFSNDADVKARQDYLNELGSPDGWLTMAQVEKYDERFKFDSRNWGAEILTGIMECEDNEIVLQDSSSFIKDSLFCEYAYVIDFDKRTFEIYIGFNNQPVPAGERFADLEIEKVEEGRDQYYPCLHLKTYSLDNLPTEEEFLAELTLLLKEENEEA